MRVQIDAERCQGHQMCAITAPLLFGSDEDGNGVVLIEGTIPPELEDAARKAVGSCPERAVSAEA